MKIDRLLALPGMTAFVIASIIAPVAAQASDFPTTGRVEYVLECMKNHAGKYEYLYKCSCAIDHIATDLDYDNYVEISTATRSQTMGGARGAEFRDPQMIKAMASKYKAIQASANEACFVQ